MRLLWLACLVGCGFSPAATSDARTGDGKLPIDAPPDVPNDPHCFGAPPFYVCSTTIPSGTIDIMPPADAKTGDPGDPSNTDCQSNTPPGEVATMNGVSVCLFAASTITVHPGGPMDTYGISGVRPIVLAGDTVTIQGTIDASSSLTGGKGPAADSNACDSTGIAGTTAGGGAGGSFGAPGGNGGAGNAGTSGTATAGVTSPPATLRGGCAGGQGAGPQNVNGGDGGGAIYVVARATLHVSGTIDASGAGGAGGKAAMGGAGGGGSGGMIVLSAGTLDLMSTAQIFANGGAGGGGAGNGTDGDPGADATMLNAAAVAPTTTMQGRSPGGNGGFKGKAAQPAPASTTGGGGGGGSVGVIRVLSGSPAAMQFSPTPSN